MNKNTDWKRVFQVGFVKPLTFFLLCSFLSSDILHAASLSGFPASGASQKTLNALDLSSFQVPTQFSQYKEGYQAPMRGGVPAPLVVLIQDAHANLSGQENLAKTLDALMDRYQFSDVFVEGGEGDVTLTPLRELADASVIKRVAGRFLREAQISGEEYLNLTSSRDMKLTGIEDLDLYSKGLLAYADLAQKRETILNYLVSSRAAVEQLKKRHYPHALLAYEKASGRISSPEKLAQLAQGQGIEVSDFKESTRLSALVAEERKIDFSLAQLERASLVEKVGAKDSGNLAKELALQPKQKGVGQLAYFKKIAEAAKAHGLSLSATPQFQNYFVYLEKFSKLDMEKLLEESKKLEQMVYTQLLDHTQAHTLHAVDRYLSLLETAYRIQMTSDEFASFLENTPDFPTISWQAFLNKALFDEGLTESFIPLERHLEEGRQVLEKFYRVVDERDFAFIKNVEKVMKNKKIAALIAGGYHTRHLAKLLREKGYSYVVVAPNVTSETNQAKYEKVLLSPLAKQIKIVQTVQGRALKAGVDGQRALALALRPEAVENLANQAGVVRGEQFILAAARLSKEDPTGARLASYYLLGKNINSFISEQRLNGLIDNQQKRIRTRLQVGVGKYVEDEKRKGKKLSDSIVSVTVKSVMDWLQSPAIDKYTKLGLLKALAQQRFGHITAAHSSKVVFGTAGPRQFTVFNMEEANELLEKGFQAEILKGPKTINSITFMRLAEGTARYYKKVAEKQGRPPVMTLAYDSRIQNPAFADAVAAVFIRNGFNVYLFDQASPTPVLSFGAAYVKSHVGILLSASHNDYRYGGFKVFGGDGAQLGPNERNGVIEHTYGKGAVGAKDYVPPVELNDIEEVLSASAQVESDAYTPETLKQNIYRGPLVRQFSEGSPRQVTILGEKNNAGDAKTPAQIDIISIYVKHVLNQFADLDLVRRQAPNIKLLYMPFYGVGLRVFTRVLKELGFKDENVKIAKEVARMDGRFPIFSNQLDAEGNPQIPDPGSSKGNADAVEMAIQQHIQDTNNDPVEALGGIDVQIGTDPDADRAGASVPIPEEFLPKEEAQRRALLISYAAGDPEAAKRLGFSGLRLLSANDKWTLITKYRIDRFAEKIAAGSIEKDTPFVIIKSHVTTDALKALVNYGKKRGVQVEIDNTYVGFSLLAEKGKRAWEEGKVVLSMAEESGGFSYMGAPPPFYLIMSQFQKIDGLNLRISGDQIVANNKVSGLLTTEVAKYYHYSAQSLRDTLEFLSEEGVLERADGGFKLSRAYAAKRTASHDEFWTPLRSLAVETPGSAHGDPTFGFIPHQMGNMGHTLDKDGPMASFLLLEVLA